MGDQYGRRARIYTCLKRQQIRAFELIHAAPVHSDPFVGVGGITVSGEVFQRASHAVLCAGLYDSFSEIRCDSGVLTQAPVVHEILLIR